MRYFARIHIGMNRAQAPRQTGSGVQPSGSGVIRWQPSAKSYKLYEKKKELPTCFGSTLLDRLFGVEAN